MAVTCCVLCLTLLFSWSVVHSVRGDFQENVFLPDVKQGFHHGLFRQAGAGWRLDGQDMTISKDGPLQSEVTALHGDRSRRSADRREGNSKINDSKVKGVLQRLEEVDDLDDGQPQTRRLPTNLLPRHYSLRVYPELPGDGEPAADVPLAAAEEGIVLRSSLTVEMVCDRPTASIVMNSLGLEFSPWDVSLTTRRRLAYHPPRVTRVHQDWKSQQLLISLSRPCYRQEKLKLSIYNIRTRARRTGHQHIFGATYYPTLDANNKTRLTFMTLFEPVSARQIFPCFDEPLFKATFTLAIIHQQRFTPLSNMPVSRQKPYPNDLVLTEFEKTPRMAPYMLEIMLTNEHIFINTTWRSQQIRVFAREEEMRHVSYGLDLLPRVLDIMASYTGVPYNLPKLDIVSTTPYTWTMEHWGIITMKMDDFKYDVTTDVSYSHLFVTHIIIHEMVHQWYGNIVTCEWWEEVFVNEGVTSYLTTEIMQKAHPEWDAEGLRHLSFMVSRVFNTDQTEYSVPLYGNLRDVMLQPSNVFTVVFTNQMYQKAPVVLKMLEDVMGTENVHQALRIFVQRHQYDVASVRQLWTAFTQVAIASDVRDADGAVLDVAEFMAPWMETPGFPIVTIIYLSPGKVLLTQRSASEGTPLNETRWTFPIRYLRTSQGMVEEGIAWMKAEEDVMVLEFGTRHDDWLLLNPGRTGYYQILYDDVMADRIGQALLNNASVIDHIARHVFLSDIFTTKYQGLSFAKSKGLDKILQYLPSQERSGLVWVTVLTRVRLMGASKEYIQELLNQVYFEVGWDSQNDLESMEDKWLRSVVLAGACMAGHSNCTSTAYDLLQQWILNDRRPPPDTVPAIACARQNGYGIPMTTAMRGLLYEQLDSFVEVILLYFVCGEYLRE